jgi:hypothetical protein
MINFLSPLWLFGLAAWLVPVAIHLFSRKAARRVQVGSIRFLQAVASNRFRFVSLSEIPLLLLRLLLLTVFVLLLAEPSWQSDSGTSSGWVLISPDVNIAALPEPIGQKVDSLAAAGFDIRKLSPDFPRMDSRQSVSRSEANVWSLVRDADKKLETNQSLWVVTTARLMQLHGNRPLVTREMHWLTVPSDSESTWIQTASVIGKDSLRIQAGVSKSALTRFRTYTLPLANRTSAENGKLVFQISPEASGGFKMMLNGSDSAVAKTPSPINVVIAYSRSRAEDARYVAAAVQSSLRTDDVPCQLTMKPLPDANLLSDSVGAMFWLSPDDVPQSILKQCHLFIRDAATETFADVQSELMMTNEKVNLFRRSKPDTSGVPLWHDTFGVPMLTIQQLRGGIVYQYAGRFHPSWSDLVLRTAFPDWVHGLFAKNGDAAKESRFDVRQVSTDQIVPTQSLASVQGERSTALNVWLWLLLFVLFGIERWISERRRSNA